MDKKDNSIVKEDDELIGVYPGVYGGSHTMDEATKEALKNIKFRAFDAETKKEINLDPQTLGGHKRWSGALYLDGLDKSKKYFLLVDPSSIPDGYNYWFTNDSAGSFDADSMQVSSSKEQLYLDGSTIGENTKYGFARLHLDTFDVIFPLDEETAKKIYVYGEDGKIKSFNPDLKEGTDYVKTRVTKDNKINIPTDFSKEGYRLDYWYASHSNFKDNDGNKKEYDLRKNSFAQGKPFAGWDEDEGINNNETLKGANSYIALPKLFRPTVKFNSNYEDENGKVEEKEQDVFYKQSFDNNKTSLEELPNIETPTREGYIFKGWNTKADGTGQAFDSATIVEEDQTVYAQWEEVKADQDYLIVEWKTKDADNVTHQNNYTDEEDGKAPGIYKGKPAYLQNVIMYEGTNTETGEKEEFFVYGVIRALVGQSVAIEVPKEYTDKDTGKSYKDIKYKFFYLPTWGTNKKWGYTLHGTLTDEKLLPDDARDYQRIELIQQANTHVDYKKDQDAIFLENDKDKLDIEYKIKVSKKSKGVFGEEEIAKLKNSEHIKAVDKFKDGKSIWLSTLSKKDIDNMNDGVEDNHLDLFSNYTGKYKNHRLVGKFTGENAENQNKYYYLDIQGNDLDGWTVTLKSRLKEGTQERTQEIEYKTIRKPNPELPEGFERVVQEGQNGVKTYTDKIIYLPKSTSTRSATPVDQIAEIVKKEEDTVGKVTLEATPKIIEYGTKKYDKEETKTETVKASTKYEADPSLGFRETKEETKPVDGEKTITITRTVDKDGKIVESSSEEITKEPTPGLTKVGNVDVSKEEIQFKTIQKEDPTLAEGETKVEQEGVVGEKTITTTWEVNPLTGTLANPSEESEVTKEAQDKIVLVGTKKTPELKEFNFKVIFDDDTADYTATKEAEKLTPAYNSFKEEFASTYPGYEIYEETFANDVYLFKARKAEEEKPSEPAASFTKKATFDREEIPYKTIRRENKDLAPGEERIVQAGKAGKKVTPITEFYDAKTGELIKREQAGDPVITEAVDEIIEYGPKAQDPGKDDNKPSDETPGKDDKPSDETPGKDEKPSDETPGKDDKPSDETPGKDDKPSDETPGKDEKPSDETPAKDDKPSDEKPSDDGKTPAKDPKDGKSEGVYIPKKDVQSKDQGSNKQGSTNVKTGVGSLAGIFGALSAAAAGLFATKKKEDK